MNMSRLEKIWTTILVLATACVQGLAAQYPTELDSIKFPVPHIWVNVDIRLQAWLGKIADTATVEHFACLGGTAFVHDGDTLLAIRGAFLPRTVNDAGHGLVLGGCPEGTLLGWHNHLYGAVKTFFEQQGWKVTGDSAQACYLSPVDFQSGLWKTGTVFGEVVQVNARTFCWWFTSQLHAIPPDWWAFIHPLAGQSRSDWGDAPREQPKEPK